MNQLFYGDNLQILQSPNFQDGCIDLIYLDPPFNSSRDYNVLFSDLSGQGSPAQIKAFSDTWNWSGAAESWDIFPELCPVPRLIDLMEGFISALGKCDMTAYLVMMAPRLYQLHRVLKPTGSLYLHCDPTASHYLKLILDSIFGPKNFLNEIIWSYRRWPAKARQFQTMHDVIFFYAKDRNKDKDRVFNVSYEANSPSYIKRFKGKTQMLDPETRTRKIVLEEASKGLPQRDVWDISIIAGSSNERIGYPTQKPLALLERIIEASSNPGDVVLDPFCGCGTAVAAAQALGRRWAGIDITPIATSLIQKRLWDHFSAKDIRLLTADDPPAMKEKAFEVKGLPTDVQGAKVLFEADHKNFEMWAVGLIPAIPIEKKGADKGIDGFVYFHDGGKQASKAIVQVKGGHVGRAQVHELRGVKDRERAALALFTCLEQPTRAMREEAVSAGFYQPAIGGRKVEAIQIRTIQELLNGKRFDLPFTGANMTYTQAQPMPVKNEQLGLDIG